MTPEKGRGVHWDSTQRDSNTGGQHTGATTVPLDVITSMFGSRQAGKLDTSATTADCPDQNRGSVLHGRQLNTSATTADASATSAKRGTDSTT